MYKALIISLLILAVPALGQLPGDLTCNGISYEIADAIVALNLFLSSCSLDSIAACTLLNSDIDGDSLSLTIGDYLRFAYNLGGHPNYHDYPRHPLSDTLSLASGQAYPGQTVSLPLDLLTADTILGLEFYLVPETQFVTIDTFISEPEFHIQQQSCNGNRFGFALPINDEDIILPGNHNFGDLIVTVNPDIDHPVTTSIIFSNDPRHICYTGFANIGFFSPVLVNSVIAINPTGIAQEANILPREVSIEAFPNPFNSSTTLFINSMDEAEIAIFDITGRQIAKLKAEDGKAVWDATGFSSGIYFVNLINDEQAKTIRLVLLK